MAKPKIYTRYSPPAAAGLTCSQPTRTQQHLKDEVDINLIVKRAIATNNKALFTPSQRAEFYDCTSFHDYQDALDRVAEIDDDFYSLPSAIRKEFGNDPDTYVAFMSDPRNYQKAVELGLLEGGEKVKPPVSTSGPLNPAGAPSETPKPPVSEPPAAAPDPAGHSSS